MDEDRILAAAIPRDDRRTRYVLEEVARRIDLHFDIVESSGKLVRLGGGPGEIHLVLPPVAVDTRAATETLLNGSVRFPYALPVGHPNDTGGARIGVDVLSVIFHLLAGVDEGGETDRDSHERYAPSGGALHRHNLTEVPVVDILAAGLGSELRARWPRLGSQLSRFEVCPTHDVDAPFRYAFQGPMGLARTMAQDVLRRRPIAEIARGPWRWAQVKAGDDAADPFNHFDWLMDQSERNNLRSTFFFITGRSGGRMDGDYDFGHPRIRKILRRVIDRGHHVGLHPSYNAFRSPETIAAERQRLVDMCAAEGYGGSEFPVRMHYLRYDPLVTPRILAGAGFSYDSTLGFAESAGFRRGTCHDFRVWDLQADAPLALIERPLAAMDASLFKAAYEGLTPGEAEQKMRRLMNEAMAVNGRLTLLWHNNFFDSPAHFEAYRAILSQAAAARTETAQ
jgi:hypothetical protein